ncbi:MAG: TlpA family protein disulfide reductase [Bacteroidaceae bacterium]|nr:TlpA family protein disulfide reductase [Bacteroidaceae bacterium]
MNKKIIITALLALVAMAGQAQTTKMATIKGYSSALKDGTMAMSFIDMVAVASDTVENGHFTLTFPVEKLTECNLFLTGDGCPNFLKSIFVAPDVVVCTTGEDCLFPTWKVESSLPEQTTANQIAEHTRDALNEMLRMRLEGVPYEKEEVAYLEVLRKTLDLLPSLPVNAASLAALKDASYFARNTLGFPYTEQLKAVEQAYAERAPKGYESELAYIHSLVYPQHVVQPGEEAEDADLFDMKGNTHRIAEAFSGGRYVLLDFWSLGCGPCRMAEPEMREVYEQMKGKLEIVGINRDKPSAWRESDWSKKIVWPNWSDGKMGKGGIESRYCDNAAIPYYVLLSPEKRVVWKQRGYGLGMFFGMAAAINGPRQDNSKDLSLAVTQVEATANATIVHFRYYGRKGYLFRIVKDSYLTAAGGKYKLTAANGISLDAETCPTGLASAATEGDLSDLCYTDFSLTFEPFGTLPESFDFKEGDAEDAFVIRNISVER